MAGQQTDSTIVDADRRTAATARGWVRWTRRMKAAFLDELAATCHVRDAAAAIGVAPGSVYVLRRRDPEFAEAWAAALAQGYEMLETQLLGHALRGDGPAIDNGDPARPPINVELAIKLLNDHGNRALGKGAIGAGAQPRKAMRADTNAAILKKLKAIEARLARDAGARGADPVGDGPASTGVASDASVPDGDTSDRNTPDGNTADGSTPDQSTAA